MRFPLKVYFILPVILFVGFVQAKELPSWGASAYWEVRESEIRKVSLRNEPDSQNEDNVIMELPAGTPLVTIKNSEGLSSKKIGNTKWFFVTTLCNDSWYVLKGCPTGWVPRGWVKQKTQIGGPIPALPELQQQPPPENLEPIAGIVKQEDASGELLVSPPQIDIPSEPSEVAIDLSTCPVKNLKDIEFHGMKVKSGDRFQVIDNEEMAFSLLEENEGFFVKTSDGISIAADVCMKGQSLLVTLKLTTLQRMVSGKPGVIPITIEAAQEAGRFRISSDVEEFNGQVRFLTQ